MMSATATTRWRPAGSLEKVVVAALLLLGALLRLRQYLSGRSLWADEAMLALNIVERGFAGMFKPLDYDQGAPVGFLLVEKLFNSVLGKHELALRLFPLLVGLSAMWLFYLLLRRVTKNAALLTALALFAFNPRLIYYSSEVKQYIVDAALTIALLLIAEPVLTGSSRKKDLLRLTIAGLIALWFSHPALFVLAGIGLGLLVIHLKRRDVSGLRQVAGMGILWILNIGFLYFLILRDLSQNAYMREYWQGAFLPVPPWTDPGWFLRAIDGNIRVQFGMPYAPLFVFALILAGWASLFFRNRELAVTLACILLVTLTASGLQLYPLFERMILFLVPGGLLLLGKLIEALQQKLQKYPVASSLSVVLLAAYLLYGPLVISLQSFIEPKYFEHIRPAMEHLRDSWKEGDGLFVSNGALPAFRFYAPFYGLENIPYTFGHRKDYMHPEKMLTQLDSFAGRPRVWILLSHVYESGNFNERAFLLDFLDDIGEQRREFRVPGTSVFLYLYDLKK